MTFNLYPESSYELKEQKDIYNYLIGGKGVVTLESPSGKHHTYAFNKPRDPAADFPEGTLFVYTQVSDGKWLYTGMVDKYNRFRITRASTWSFDNEMTKGAAYITDMMFGRVKNSKMKLYHAGVCSVCGRRLTRPKSIMRGIGPDCWKKEHGLLQGI